MRYLLVSPLFFFFVLKVAVAQSAAEEWDDIGPTTLRGSRELSEDVPPIVVGTEIEYGPEGEIFAGSAASSGEYPAFALLCYSGATTCGGCGGTLIASQYVLTAAHCIVDENGNSLGISGVRIGASQTQSDGTYRDVTSYANHPSLIYTRASGFLELRNDLSVLTLASAISGVTPLSYNRDSTYPSTSGTSLTAIGYGRYGTSSSNSNYLRKTTLSFQTDASCSTALGSTASADEVVCAHGSSSYTCPGDSGGPLLDSSNLILGALSFGNADCGVSTSAQGWWAETANYATWIDGQIGVSTPTTPSPTSTPAPTAAPTCECFSEAATVEVLQDGERATRPVAMKDLQVGQKIFAGVGEDNVPIYETVYGFAHRDEDQHTEYLRITASSNKKATSSSTLEITSNHLIFLQNQTDPVPAGSLQVGDVLIRQSIHQKEAGSATITGIKLIRQRGLYAPLTKDGTLIVDGFQSSSYVSAKHLYPNLIGTITKFISEHTLFHWWMAPYRIFCTHVSPRMCIDDYSEDEGYILWLVISKNLAEIFHGLSNLIIVAGLAVLLCFCGAFMMLETLLESPLFWLVQLGCACFLLQSLSSSIRKHRLQRKHQEEGFKKQD